MFSKKENEAIFNFSGFSLLLQLQNSIYIRDNKEVSENEVSPFLFI